MRPEKSWRPIVTMEIDKHHTRETILGVDGQNINQKETFSLSVDFLSIDVYLAELSLSFIQRTSDVFFRAQNRSLATFTKQKKVQKEKSSSIVGIILSQGTIEKTGTRTK